MSTARTKANPAKQAPRKDVRLGRRKLPSRPPSGGISKAFEVLGKEVLGAKAFKLWWSLRQRTMTHDAHMVRSHHALDARTLIEELYNRVKKTEEGGQVLDFIPTRYLKTEDQVWTLKNLVGEERFNEALIANGHVLDGQLVESLVAGIQRPFFLSGNRRFIFSVDFENVKASHGPLKRLTALEALRMLDVPRLEQAIEKTMVPVTQR